MTIAHRFIGGNSGDRSVPVPEGRLKCAIRRSIVPLGLNRERAPFPAINCRAIFILPLRGKDRQMSLNHSAKIKTYPYEGWLPWAKI